MRARVTVVMILLAVAVATGCGSSSDGGDDGSKPDLTVSAAASLTKAFTDYGSQFSDADAKFSFAGSMSSRPRSSAV